MALYCQHFDVFNAIKLPCRSTIRPVKIGFRHVTNKIKYGTRTVKFLFHAFPSSGHPKQKCPLVEIQLIIKLQRVQPLLFNDCEINKYTTTAFRQRLYKHVRSATDTSRTTVQQQKNGVFCVVRADMIQPRLFGATS